jgi:hypothetical protein
MTMRRYCRIAYPQNNTGQICIRVDSEEERLFAEMRNRIDDSHRTRR